MGIAQKEFVVHGSWFNSNSKVSTYDLEELIATKLRALYQRKKGRDLFDIWLTLEQYPKLNVNNVIKCFKEYTNFDGSKISKNEFKENLLLKKDDPVFTADLSPLIPKNEIKSITQNPGVITQRNYAHYNVSDAIDMVLRLLVKEI